MRTQRLKRDLDRAAGQDELVDIMSEFVAGKGLAAFGYYGWRPNVDTLSEAFTIQNYPVAWIERYMERRYWAHDPLFTEARHSNDVIVWAAADYLGHEDPVVVEINRECQAYGIRSGLMMPLRSSYGHYCFVNFISGEERMPDGAAFRGDLYIAGFHLHAAAVKLLSQVSSGGLTSRELQVLSLTAEGMSEAYIERVVGITKRTVKFHLENVRKKLGANNKYQMIHIAHRLKLL